MLFIKSDYTLAQNKRSSHWIFILYFKSGFLSGCPPEDFQHQKNWVTLINSKSDWNVYLKLCKEQVSVAGHNSLYQLSDYLLLDKLYLPILGNFISLLAGTSQSWIMFLALSFGISLYSSILSSAFFSLPQLLWVHPPHTDHCFPH